MLATPPPIGSGAAVRRPLRFDAFADVTADVDRLLAGGYRRAGQWTLAQSLDHLGRFMRLSLDGFPALPPALRPVVFVARPLIRRTILKAAASGMMRAGLPTAPYLVPEADPTDAAGHAAGADGTAAGHFAAAIGRVRDHVGEFAPSPLAGRLTAEQWRRFHLAHCAHHLSFLVPAGAA